MLVLYHIHLTRSVRIRWLLEELGVPHELKVLSGFDDPALGASEFERVHPFGRVPAIEDNGVRVFESSAIVDYILYTYDEEGKFAPRPGEAGWPEYLSWIHFAEGTLLSPVADYAINSYWRPEEERLPQVADYAKANALPLLARVSAQLGDNDFLLGGPFSAADIMIGHAIFSAGNLKLLEQENLKAYRKRLMERPGLQKALEPVG